MAIKSGSISSSFSKMCAQRVTAYTRYFDDYDYMYSKSSASATCFLYGYDFRALSNYNNVVITDIKATVTGKKYGTSSSYTYSSSIRPITDFEIANSNTTSNSNYTSITSSAVDFATYLNTTTNSEYTRSIPELTEWANNNLDKFIGGYDSNSFGIRPYVVYGYIYDIVLTVDFTYEEPEYFTVSTAVSPVGAGTVTPVTQTVEEGSTATVTATPATGYKFSHWLINGADSGVTTTTLSGTITANTTVTAVFVLDKINKIYIGTSQPKAIYVGTQEVKAVYVGTTKVYG